MNQQLIYLRHVFQACRHSRNRCWGRHPLHLDTRLTWNNSHVKSSLNLTTVRQSIKWEFIFWVTTQNYNVYNGSTEKAAREALSSLNWPPKQTTKHNHEQKVKVKQSTCIVPSMAQTTLKRSGMNHTDFNLQRTPCLPLPRKRSPDVASNECGGEHLIAAHCSFIDPERMKGWVGLVGWPIADGWLTHISGHPSAMDRAQDSERTLARDWRSTAEPCGPTNTSEETDGQTYGRTEGERTITCAVQLQVQTLINNKYSICTF